MRKTTILFIAVLATAVSAQAGSLNKNNGLYTGGEAGMTVVASNGSAGFTWNISPELGYEINDNHEVGAMLSLGGNNLGTAFTFDFRPYYRWNFYKIGDLKFFLDGIVNLGASVYKGGSSSFAWGVAVSPGLSYSFSPNWSIITHVASLGVRGTTKETTFNFSLVSGPSVGVKYNF